MEDYNFEEYNRIMREIYELRELIAMAFESCLVLEEKAMQLRIMAMIQRIPSVEVIEHDELH